MCNVHKMSRKARKGRKEDAGYILLKSNELEQAFGMNDQINTARIMKKYHAKSTKKTQENAFNSMQFFPYFFVD